MSEVAPMVINGFGRIGVVTARQILDHEHMTMAGIGGRELAVEDIEQRLMFDSVHRRLNGHEVVMTDGQLYVDGATVALVDTSDLAADTWRVCGDNLTVVEATGAYKTYDKAMRHVTAGASAVVVTSPVNDTHIPTIVRGVNDTPEIYEQAAQRRVAAVSSCSTNCIAPILKLFTSHLDVESASAQVIHARTNSQPHLDGRGNATSDRRSADNIVAASTGSATEVRRLMPRLSFYSNSIRVPVPDGSLAIINMEIHGRILAAGVLELLSKAKAEDNVIGTSDHDMFSAAVIGEPYSSVIDLNQVRVTPRSGRTSVELQAWFDNEWGYSARVLEVAAKLGQLVS